MENEDKNSKAIDIPRIEDLFKNQSKEIMAYENTTLRDRLGKMMHNLDHSINRFKNLSFSYTKPVELVSHTTTAARAHHHNNPFEEDYEKSTENRIAKSKDLRERLYKEKR
jgi:hypothetical protein